MNSRIVFNGINGATGDYLCSATPEELLAALEPPPAAELAQLDYVRRRAAEAAMGPREGIDPMNLAQTGWGVIFEAEDEDSTAGLREALRPLLEHRREQAARVRDSNFREYRG